jgi:alkylated DNA repair protein alkB family protein 6
MKEQELNQIKLKSPFEKKYKINSIQFYNNNKNEKLENLNQKEKVEEQQGEQEQQVEQEEEIKEIENSIYYIPNFLTNKEHDKLLNDQHIYSIKNQRKWVKLPERRLQNWGGKPHEKFMFEEELPNWLTGEKLKLNSLFEFPLTMKKQKDNIKNKSINHILINEYESNDGIMFHKDGPIYFPLVFIISLMNPIILTFKKQNDNFELKNKNLNEFSVFLEPKSLLIFTNEIYYNYLHGIDTCQTFQIKNNNGCKDSSSSTYYYYSYYCNELQKEVPIINQTFESITTYLTKINEEKKENDTFLSNTYQLQRKKRVSLTCRRVKKVMKNKLFF